MGQGRREPRAGARPGCLIAPLCPLLPQPGLPSSGHRPPDPSSAARAECSLVRAERSAWRRRRVPGHLVTGRSNTDTVSSEVKRTVPKEQGWVCQEQTGCVVCTCGQSPRRRAGWRGGAGTVGCPPQRASRGAGLSWSSGVLVFSVLPQVAVEAFTQPAHPARSSGPPFILGVG